MSFEERLARGTPLPPCTSSTRRADIGGLPPRVGIPIAPDDTGGLAARGTRSSRPCAAHGRASRACARRQKIDRVRRALASGAALGAVLGPDEGELREQAEAMDAADPRLLWLLSQAPRWRDAREKTLVFVAHRETLEMLRTALSQRAQLATGVFHEELSAGAPRHRGRPVPGTRWAEPARVHRMRRRGPQLRVLPPAGAVRPPLETIARGTADRPARSDRPAYTGGDRVLPAAGRNRRGRRAALRRSSGSSANRSPGWSRSWPTWRAPSRTIAVDPLASLSGERFDGPGRTRPTRLARASAKRPISSSIATPTDRRWRPASSRACPWNSTRSTRKWWSRPASAWASPSSVREDSGPSRSSSAAGRWSTVCLASPAGRATSAHSTARRPSRTRRSTSSPPGIRSWRGSLPTSKRAPSAAWCGSKSRSARNATRASWLSTRTGPRSRWSRSTAAGHARPDWAAAFHGRSLRVSGVISKDHDWTVMVRRLGAQLDPARRPHAIAAIVVRPPE